MSEDVTTVDLRPAAAADLAELGRLVQLSRSAAAGAMPASSATPAEQRAWVEGWDLSGADHEVWVAESGAGELLGVARFTATWLDDLYVHPAAAGAGVGSALMQLVQALRPAGFGLWVFVSNTPAQAFYARHGCVVVGRTDGSQNAEQAAELELSWSP